MSLAKYEAKCLNVDCEKKSIVLVDQDETEVPSLCPFCGHETEEVN